MVWYLCIEKNREARNWKCIIEIMINEEDRKFFVYFDNTSRYINSLRIALLESKFLISSKIKSRLRQYLLKHDPYCLYGLCLKGFLLLLFHLLLGLHLWQRIVYWKKLFFQTFLATVVPNVYIVLNKMFKRFKFVGQRGSS